MRAFLDFEASSLGRDSYPIEVAWAFEDGASEAHLIRPAPDWTDWSDLAQAIHHIPRATLERDGAPHDAVAARMVAALDGHALFASAPSWDGKWLSALLRAAGLPRHRLRLRATGDAARETARAILARSVAPEALDAAVGDVLALCELRFRDEVPAHRALADAEGELRRWRYVRACAEGSDGGVGRWDGEDPRRAPMATQMPSSEPASVGPTPEEEDVLDAGEAPAPEHDLGHDRAAAPR